MNNRLSEASFRQKLDSMSKNIIRNQNPLKLVFKDISIFGLKKSTSEKNTFLVKSLLKHLNYEISSYVHALISLEVLKITQTTTTTITIKNIFHHNNRHHRHHNHLDETTFCSCFNLCHKLRDKMIFFNQYQQYHLHKQHNHLMIILFSQSPNFF